MNKNVIMIILAVIGLAGVYIYNNWGNGPPPSPTPGPGPDPGPSPFPPSVTSTSLQFNKTGYAFLPAGEFNPGFDFTIEFFMKTHDKEGIVVISGRPQSESAWFSLVFRDNRLILIGAGESQSYLLPFNAVVNDGKRHSIGINRKGEDWLGRVDGKIVMNGKSGTKPGDIIPPEAFAIGGLLVGSADKPKFSGITGCIDNIVINNIPKSEFQIHGNVGIVCL